MEVQLDYGRHGLTVRLPEANVVKVLCYRPAQPLVDLQVAVREKLLSPVGTPPLPELAQGKSSACVAICDITRPVPNELILSELLPHLERAGLSRDRIVVLVATGLHRPNLGHELVEIAGASIVGKYRIENHHGENLEEHVFLGETPRGVPMWIDRRWVEADLKIAVGLIEPHFMAGYSGGRKLICPGLAGLPTIREWHSPRFLEHPHARSGMLDGNPVHLENTWIAKQAGCDFTVNVVLDEKRRLVDVQAGEMEEAFHAGVAVVDTMVRDSVPEPVDIVITTAAGYPLDATFYQSVKGMVAAEPLVKPGGTIILAAALSEGVGSPDFTRIFEENRSLEEFLEKISSPDYFRIDQWQLELMARVARKARIVVVSDGLPAEYLRRLFVEPAASVEEAVVDCLDRYGPHATIAVMPKGPYLVAEVASATEA